MAYKNIFSLISNKKCQLKLPGDTFMRFSKIKMSDAPGLCHCGNGVLPSSGSVSRLGNGYYLKKLKMPL